ncbi:MAG: hypothetical protein HOC20_08135, partial [Chloroflexi bacterium]|nr:hypothetical protein [Chloroflexota bacterium]
MGTEFFSATVRIILVVVLLSVSSTKILAQEPPDYRMGMPGGADQLSGFAPQYVPRTSSRLAATLPEAVDNSDGLPPVSDRGAPIEDELEAGYSNNNGSIAWALAYYLKTYQEGKEHGWDVSLPEHQFSPAFIYNHRIKGLQNMWWQIRSALDFITRHGCATLEEMPLEEFGSTSLPPAEVYKSALKYRADYYEEYYDQDSAGVAHIIETVKELLAAGEIIPMVIQFNTFEVRDGIRTYDLDSLDRELNGDADTYVYNSYEAVVVVGYDDTKGDAGAFKVVNSMGTDWGDNGFAWLSYDIRDRYMDTFFLVDRTDYTPSSYARVTLDHPHSGDLFCSIYAYDVNEETESSYFFSYHGGDHTGLDIYVDLTEFSAFLPPDDNSKFFLNVVDIDEDGNTSVIIDFSVEHDGATYSFTQAGYQGRDYGLTQVSMEGASVPEYSVIGGLIGGVLPREYSPYYACESVYAAGYYQTYFIPPGGQYHRTGTLYIGGRSAPSFTIEPGTVIEFAKGTKFFTNIPDISIRGIETDIIHLRPHYELRQNATSYRSVVDHICGGNCWGGVGVYSRNIIIEYCSISDAQYGLILSISEGCTAVTRNNIIRNIARVGIKGESHPSQDPSLEITNNLIDSVGRQGIELNYFNSSTNNTIIRNNVITNSFNGGIRLLDSSPVLENNTILFHQDDYDPSRSEEDALGAGIYVTSGGTPVLKNNIISDNAIGILSENMNTVSAYNILWNNGLNYKIISSGATDLSVNPQFVNPDSGDYHLTPFSPAMDAGDPESDFSNEPEPHGSRINI